MASKNHLTIKQIFRKYDQLGMAVCLLAILAAFAIELTLNMEPCPICILQRVAVAKIFVLYLIAFFHKPKATARLLYPILRMFIALFGIVLALRHVWLQNMPSEEIPPCLPGLEYLLENFSILEIINLMLEDTGDCTKINYILGIPLSIWTMLFLGLVLCYNIIQVVDTTDNNN